MPNYEAECPQCETRREVLCSYAEREAKIAALEPCCGVPLRHVPSLPRAPDVAFAPGMYDIGLGGPQRFESWNQMQKTVDNHNREAAKRGSAGIKLTRRKN